MQDVTMTPAGTTLKPVAKMKTNYFSRTQYNNAHTLHVRGEAEGPEAVCCRAPVLCLGPPSPWNGQCDSLELLGRVRSTADEYIRHITVQLTLCSWTAHLRGSLRGTQNLPEGVRLCACVHECTPLPTL